MQTGGVTLTLGIAYLTVLTHERNRRTQAENLRLQSRVLHGLLEPTPVPPPQSRADLARKERSTLVETAKDRWNDELENAVRLVQRTDWTQMREGMEGAIARLLGSGLQKSREGIEEAEKAAGPKVQEVVDRSTDVVKRAKDQAAVDINEGAAMMIRGAERAGTDVQAGASKIATVAKAKANDFTTFAEDQAGEAKVKSNELGHAAKAETDRVVADTKSRAHNAADAIKHSGGTIDAARGAVRDAVHKGIEMGKEAVGKAQAAVGLAAEKMESKAQSSALSHSSAVEKALHERYQKPDALDQKVEEALKERYKPIDKRDNTVLRGV